MKEKRFDWGALASGILFLGLGGLTLVEPYLTMNIIVILAGIAIIVKGISNIAFFIKYKSRLRVGTNIALLVGIVDIILGILFLFNVNAGITFFGFLFAIWFIIEGITNLSNLWYASLLSPGFYLLHILVSAIGLVLGIVLLFMPLGSSLIMSTMLGFYLMFFGIMQIVSAFMRRAE